MTKKLLTGSALAMLVVAGACTVHQTETPPLAGPSGLARSVTMTAIPDRLTQDGASQSSVSAQVIGPDGRPLGGISLRMDMLVAGQPNDYGTLSARTMVTGSDGMARVVYTAPPASPPPANTSESTVSIRATSIGSDAVADSSVAADIRLVPAGVILPPAGTPTAAFTMSPATALMNVPVTFDASGSSPGAGASSISSYSWNFGDGTAAGTGKSVTHTFTSLATFNVTLTVTNARGLSASTTIATAVGGLALPQPKFVFSPTAPQVGQTVVFNADQSTAAPGHTLTQFNWNFGDGATKSGNVVEHDFGMAGSYNVVLSVTDDAGQKGTIAQTVTVAAGGGGGGGATVASFVASPTAPVVGQVVFFNGSGSTAATGRTLTDYRWDFGDGTVFANTSASTSHTFTTASTFTVQLRVTDDTGQTATVTNTVTIAAAGAVAPTANFTFSPSTPGVNQSVFFNAASSTAATGHTLSSYAWNFGDGTPTGTGVTPSHPYSAAGTFTVTLTVTDEIGQTSVTSKTVTISGAAATPPTATFTFSPAAPGVGETVFFNSTSTPGAGHVIVSYAWTFGDGFPGTFVNPTTHIYLTAGSYSVQLKVTDEIGQSTTSAATTIAIGNPPAPTANFTFSPTSPVIGQTVVFDASSSTTAQGQTIVRIDWNFGDATPIIACPGAAACNGTRIISHVFSAPGTYTVNAVVTDSAGRTASHNTTVPVGSGNPIPSFTVNPGSPLVGQDVTFDASGTQVFGGATIQSYQWTFGDGRTSTNGPVVTLTPGYASAGSKTVTLTVVDSLGRRGSTSVVVTVVP